jgi:hypothetical protein
VAIVLAPLVAGAGGPVSRTTKVKGTVDVGNFPATQNVGGTVNVGNLPAVQHVDGTVSVGNLPVTQQVAGTVSVTPGLPGTPYDGETDGGSISVPTGRTWVLQSVDFECAVPTGDAPVATLHYQTGGASEFFYIPLPSATTLVYTLGGDGVYQTIVNLNLYLDGGSELTPVCQDETAGVSEGYIVGASGYLI